MAKFDPNEKTADEVVDHLENADEAERQRVAAAELQGKERKTVLEAAGVDADVRVDGNGRRLYPWEVDPAKQVRVTEAAEAEAK